MDFRSNELQFLSFSFIKPILISCNKNSTLPNITNKKIKKEHAS